MAKVKKIKNKLKKSEETYLFCVLRNVLKFGFSKKDLIRVLKKI